jgi:hypothetical protein
MSFFSLEERQTTQWPKRRRTYNTMAKRRRTYNTMVKRRRTENTMAKKKKDIQHNGQKEEGHTLCCMSFFF